ncbi:aldehyde dehydrogenase family protein [Janthinobacterium sp. PLB04]|uniref:Aldehyde dehydrogenase family protein n=2 Tax=Oxalobacteraceae TaxID=75682 RepID=A0AAJ4MXE8_9BURK|nr:MULTISPECIES: aldehyde dehydrogenase family protein [Janthinobacterium]KAB0332307.1 aldehyde dehydrogenase family protein [Janthinobacterium lividum]QSX99060.1 aldehyde dehydrogenase family protein [Janthinobacterium lividum]UGQ39012.1 aldehyde dehydrogenase family protein [Janthinobacterium sp. PLB04]
MDYGPAPESQKEAQAWLAGHQRTFGLFIDNAWSEPAELFASTNPADGTQLAELTQASDADVERAVEAARRALPVWQGMGGHGRAKVMYALARLLQKHSRLFAVLETLDNGKTIRETRDIDLPLAARHFYHHAGWAQLQSEEFADYRAVGVVGQIVPWNFPLLMLSWKIAPALAAGNTVVFKPAEFTSLTAMLFAELCVQAGVPAGVVNIVTGDGRVGSAIVNHPGVDKIAFTGSTEVGRLIREATAGSGKKLSLELGGKSPFIVFEDADLDGAVEGLVDSIWFNQGQVCCAGSRLLVQESIQERFLNKVRARMENLRLGSPLDKSMDVGALVDPVQRQRIAALVDSARAEGCDVWQPACELPADGSWFPPTLITGASTSAAVAQAEIFGPVLVAMSFRTPPEAVQLANNTVYGLAASVWTESISLALDIAPAIKAGVVWINSANQFDAACGFGGYRESGFGREGGREGMLEYMTALAEDARPALPVVEAKAKGNVKPAAADPFAIDRTAKMYIGGKQARPDSAYSTPVFGANGTLLAEVGVGSRKDIRNAVEAAHKASGWTGATAHNRAQVLYYIAENLAARADEFAARIAAMTGSKNPEKEVQASIERLFYYAAWADKYDGLAHQPPTKGITVALNEAVGVIGIVCPNEAPLLGFISLVAPAIALGNRVVVVPSEAHPLSAMDLYQVFDTSDLPGGVVNIISGNADELARTLATHADIDAVWRHDGSSEGCAEVERLSAGTLKRTWVGGAKGRDWYSAAQSGGRAVLAHASQVKNVWIPYGV